MSNNPFVNGWCCEECGNPTFYFINDGGCVGVLSCVKCGCTKEILLDTYEDE